LDGTFKKLKYNHLAKSKIETAYRISYPELKEKLSSSSKYDFILLFIYNEIILNEILDLIGKKFIGKNYDKKIHLNRYYSDESNLNKILSESSNIGFFTEKKINLLKYVKKTGARGLKKDDKDSLLKYIHSPNPDTVFVLAVTDKNVNPAVFSDMDVPGVNIYLMTEPTEDELLQWMREKLKGYSVEKETLETLLNYIELSYDSAEQEINKLISFNAESDKITIDSVKKCTGFSKEFSEMDFVKAILSRDSVRAIEIYKNLYLKSDVELKLLAYLNNVYTGMSKIISPEYKNITNPKYELKLFSESELMLKLYYGYVREINELKIKKVFDYICTTDIMIKYSKYDRYTVFIKLIYNLTKI